MVVAALAITRIQGLRTLKKRMPGRAPASQAFKTLTQPIAAHEKGVTHVASHKISFCRSLRAAAVKAAANAAAFFVR
jgi:hypothetical protein